MKNKDTIKKLRRVIVLVAFLVLTALIGTSLAYYTGQGNLDNTMITQARSEVYLSEYFLPNDLWLPGETKDKKVQFGNQREVDQVIRYRVITEWFDNKGTPDNLDDDIPWAWTGTYDPEPAVINYTSEITGPGETWTLHGSYYYYNKVLPAKKYGNNSETPPVIESVTFSWELSNGKTQADDFSNKTCRITIQMEAVAVDPEITTEAWGMKFTKNGNELVWSEP